LKEVYGETTVCVVTGATYRSIPAVFLKFLAAVKPDRVYFIIKRFTVPFSIDQGIHDKVKPRDVVSNKHNLVYSENRKMLSFLASFYNVNFISNKAFKSKPMLIS
jgi:hypothetical protein